ncbi:G-protein coupled receptor moody isoform X3 [Eurytemora carolleeae]|uniref:G-protein coupled receptor moody isoform X3 n=1 Tax=Eurytemora carolleeae TaxID=1294199 RepID=UPI000C758C91|nr:G-protein coupled receptor moody isoform X3 [Eurytemora carolleeae]|eukprot:XP_023341816.1 G-protein coupled receptor moody-like isoform X3 [Eurytemora affinis]
MTEQHSLNLSGNVENTSDWILKLDISMFQDYPDWMLNMAFSFCIIFLVCGLPGNIVTILALCKCKKVRNTTAIFIINLSVSDLLFCSFNLPLAASVFQARRWVWGSQLCQLFPFLRYGLLAVSIFNILAITINRYIMIAHPTLYPRLYSKQLLPLHVIGTWIGGFGSLVPTLASVWGEFGLDPGIGSCTILHDRNGRSPKQFLFVFAFLAPCLAIILCYARIFVIAHKAAKKSGKKKESKVIEYKQEDVNNVQIVNREKHEFSSSLPSSLLSSMSGKSKDTMTSSLQTPSPFLESLEKPQITKENEIGEFGVHLCVPGYIDPSVPHRSTGLNGENEERVLHSMLEGGVCTKRDGLSDFDVQQEKQAGVLILREEKGKKLLEEEDEHGCISGQDLRGAEECKGVGSEVLHEGVCPDVPGEHKVAGPGFSEEHKAVVPGVPDEHKGVCTGVPEEHKAVVPEVPEENKGVCTLVSDAHEGGCSGVPDARKGRCIGIPDAHKGGCPEYPGEHTSISLTVLGKKEDFKLNLPGLGTRLDSKIVFGPGGGTHDKLEVQKDKGYYEPGKLNIGRGLRRESCVSFSLRIPNITPGFIRNGTRRRSLRPGKLSQKDRRLLKMILVIFISFLVCYLPITLVKVVRDPSLHLLSILGYILIYLSTCINPIIYVLMSSEYRQAYRALLTCQTTRMGR